jgi:hypothetical protein
VEQGLRKGRGETSALKSRPRVEQAFRPALKIRRMGALAPEVKKNFLSACSFPKEAGWFSIY